MRELLLGGGSEIPVPTGDVLFLFDPETGKDLVSNQVCIALSNGAAIDTLNQIDGRPTIKLPQATSGGLITLPTPINFESLNEWTIEWTSHPTIIPAAYYNELLMDIAVTQNTPMGCRWANAGYYSRNQFNIANFANTDIGQPPITKSDVVNKDNRWAMVYKGGQLRIYYGGVRQLLAFGVSIVYGQDYINKTQPGSIIAKMYIGWYNSVNQSWIGNMGRIRISNFARYLGNYTPIPF